MKFIIKFILIAIIYFTGAYIASQILPEHAYLIGYITGVIGLGTSIVVNFNKE